MTSVSIVAAGDITVTITCQHLKFVHAIYDVEVKATSPPTSVGVISHKSVNGAVIALTLQSVGIDTTLTLESVLLGN